MRLAALQVRFPWLMWGEMLCLLPGGNICVDLQQGCWDVSSGRLMLPGI